MKHYETLEDLPRSLREELPERAQHIYLAKYRETWTKCHMGGVTSETELAALAHDAGMLAVEGQFEKDERGRWRDAPVGSAIDPDKLEGRAPDHE
jgi:cation transport regulator ChaB